MQVSKPTLIELVTAPQAAGLLLAVLADNVEGATADLAHLGDVDRH
jgi:hypothetical protein